MKGMTIGQVARQAGLRTSAIRYYEAQRLIPPARRSSGMRVYGEEILTRLALIAAGRSAGLGIAELRTLVADLESSDSPREPWRRLADRKQADLAFRIRELRAMQRKLTRLARCCCRSLEECGERLRTAMR